MIYKWAFAYIFYIPQTEPVLFSSQGKPERTLDF
jgi:hypothetical protein